MTPTTITLIPDVRGIIVNYGPKIDGGEAFVSENGSSTVTVKMENGIPVVSELFIQDSAKYTLIEDWLDEAIAAALGEKYDDNYYKGTYGV